MAMLDTTTTAIGTPLVNGYELRYPSLFQEGRCLAFPCDEKGNVEMNALSERARNNYLFARALVGRDYAFPVVAPRFH